MRRFSRLLQRSALASTINVVANGTVRLDADDVYKLCMLLSGNEDHLGLKENTPFMHAVYRARFALPPDSLPPFQASVVDGVLAKVDPPPSTGLGGHASLGGSGDKAAVKGFSPTGLVLAEGEDDHPEITFSDPTVEERIRAIWDCVSLYQQQSYTTSDGRKVADHCAALDPIIRKLSSDEVTSLVRALATLNFYDFNFSTLLARRCCEICATFTPRQLCQTYFNLLKLNVQDSLVAIVRRIDASVPQLTWKDIFLFTQALERQQNTTAAPTAVVPKILSRSLEVLKDVPSPSFFRALLIAALRYNAGRHPAIPRIAAEAARFAEQMVDRDLVPILQALAQLQQFKATGFAALFARASDIVPTMDMHMLPQLVDVISMCPLDSTVFMDRLMTRLTNEAGKLTISNLIFMIDLISGYPPVKGTPCAVALAFTARVRQESLDSAGVEQVLLGLARMQHFTDDFVGIAEFAYSQRQGIRSVEALASVLQCLTPAAVKDPSIRTFIERAVETLSPIMNDEEQLQLKKVVHSIGITDRAVVGKMFARARSSSITQMRQQRQNTRLGGARRYDPADDLL